MPLPVGFSFDRFEEYAGENGIECYLKLPKNVNVPLKLRVTKGANLVAKVPDTLKIPTDATGVVFQFDTNAGNGGLVTITASINDTEKVASVEFNILKPITPVSANNRRSKTGTSLSRILDSKGIPISLAVSAVDQIAVPTLQDTALVTVNVNPAPPSSGTGGQASPVPDPIQLRVSFKGGKLDEKGVFVNDDAILDPRQQWPRQIQKGRNAITFPVRANTDVKDTATYFVLVSVQAIVSSTESHSNTVLVRFDKL